MIGGAIMLCAVGFPNIASFSLSNPNVVSTLTPQNLPRLIPLVSFPPSRATSGMIAVEATDIPGRATKTRVPPTSAINPHSTLVETTVGATPTALFLLHEQQPNVIGYSAAGRQLNVYTFGSGEHQRMIVADIHGGDEWNTMTLANQLIQYLNQYPDLIPDDATLYILPSLNPDGEARAHNKYGRLNHNGVDLNRNFPVNWKAAWDRGGCWNYLPSSGGTGPGSEAEAQAFMNFINSHNIEALVSYHSAALGIFPGGNPWDENSVRFAESIATVSSYPFPPIDTGCKYSGTLADYAVSQGTAAVDLELTNHIDTDFDMNLNILEVLLNWQ